MNLMLLTDADFITPHRVRITGRRWKHLRRVIRPELGDTVTCGLLGGALGEAQLVAWEPDAAVLDVVYERPAPPPLPVTLLMALPRPKSLFKLLQPATTLGVKSIHLYNSARVDKSFWQSHQLQPEALREHMILGLEQAADTVLPSVTLHRRFGAFSREVLPKLDPSAARLLAHPSDDARACPARLPSPCVVALGPERGLIEHEVRQFRAAGFAHVHLGPRILRTEQAMMALLGRAL